MLKKWLERVITPLKKLTKKGCKHNTLLCLQCLQLCLQEKPLYYKTLYYFVNNVNNILV